MTKNGLSAVVLVMAMAGAASEADAASTVAKRLPVGAAPLGAEESARLARVARDRMKLIPFNARAYDAKAAENPSPEGAAGASGARPGATRAYGKSMLKWPYSESRVANSSDQPSTLQADSPVSALPYRATGKLYVRWGADWYACTAALVKPGVLLTAAHCVHNFGQGPSGFIDEAVWIPANSGPEGGALGIYYGFEIRIPSPQFDGTDSCAERGVVCSNDIATIALGGGEGQQAGNLLGGWYDYGWNGYSFAVNSAMGRATVADITQLGYPAAFDGGNQMQRNNSFGKLVREQVRGKRKVLNVEIGSPLTGGSSGGPWLVNFGTPPQIDSEASAGRDAAPNVVMGVTSWGYGMSGINIQGASWFGQNSEYPDAAYGSYGAGNIGKLMHDTCMSLPGNC